MFLFQIEEELSTDLPETEECPYLVRVGWSPLEGTMVVGEERFSFGYENSGKKVNGKSKEDYGQEYTVGDIITCYIVSWVLYYIHVHVHVHCKCILQYLTLWSLHTACTCTCMMGATCTLYMYTLIRW